MLRELANEHEAMQSNAGRAAREYLAKMVKLAHSKLIQADVVYDDQTKQIELWSHDGKVKTKRMAANVDRLKGVCLALEFMINLRQHQSDVLIDELEQMSDRLTSLAETCAKVMHSADELTSSNAPEPAPSKPNIGAQDESEYYVVKFEEKVPLFEEAGIHLRIDVANERVLYDNRNSTRGVIAYALNQDGYNKAIQAYRSVRKRQRNVKSTKVPH